MYLQAMTKMCVTPQQTLIVEDSPHGLEAARRAGAHVCQVSGFQDVTYARLRAALDRIESAPSSTRAA